MAFGLWSAENAPSTDEHVTPGAFFHVVPAENVRLGFQERKQGFPSWVLANGLRDCVEAVHTFLEEARRICSLWTHLAQGNRITGDEWNEWLQNEEDAAAGFHRKSLPDKFDALAMYDSRLVTPIKDLVLTVNRARNCLVHRGGTVTSVDANTPDGLLVRWLKMELIVRGAEGERVAAPGEIVHAGEAVGVRQRETSKLFRLGERVLFTAQDFNDISMTLLRFCEGLTAQLEEFGKSKGVRFTGPAVEHRGAGGPDGSAGLT